MGATKWYAGTYTGKAAGTLARCREYIHAVAGVPKGSRWGLLAPRRQVIVYSYSQSALGARPALTLVSARQSADKATQSPGFSYSRGPSSARIVNSDLNNRSPFPATSAFKYHPRSRRRRHPLSILRLDQRRDQAASASLIGTRAGESAEPSKDLSDWFSGKINECRVKGKVRNVSAAGEKRAKVSTTTLVSVSVHSSQLHRALMENNRPTR